MDTVGPNRREKHAVARRNYTAAAHYRIDHFTRLARRLRRGWCEMLREGGRAVADLDYQPYGYII